MIDVIYPYIEADWEELKYSLRSLDMYFKEDYRVHVAGNYCPEWMTGVNYVYMPKLENREADVGQKYKWACENFDSFVLMNDDFFLLKPTTLKDIRKIRHSGLRRLKKAPATPWEHMVQASILALDTKLVYNFVTHTPRYFESKKLIEVDKKYHVFDGKSLGVLTYFNELAARKNIQLKVTDVDWITLSSESRVRPSSKHQFFSCNEAALNDSLKEYIKVKFPKPSKFEKIQEVTSVSKGTLLLYTGKKKTLHWDDLIFEQGVAYTTPERAERLAEQHPKIFQLG